MDRFWLLSVKISFQSMAFSTICIIIIINEAHAVDVLDYFDRECSSQYQPYAPNSTFETNLQTLLGSLIASTPSTGFNSTVVGDNDDRVYGHAMCRGDINSTACRGCLETAANGIVYLCNRTLEAIIWYELCQIQYSFKNFSVMVFTGKYSNPSYFRKNASDPDRLRSHWKYMMTNISEGAAVNSSLRMFATGEVSMSASRAVYGLVQCTGDISSHDCTTCLASAVGDLETCCGSTEGGTVMSINCNARFELFEFYSGPPTFMLTYNYYNGSKWKTWMTAVLALVIGFLVSVLVGCSAVLYRRRRNGQLDAEIAQSELFHGFAAPMEVRMTEEGDLVSSDELPFMDLALVMAATDNFSTANKLGQGGFGAVYKGVLPDGKEIAVKRLSKRTWQGLKEFQNEVTLIGRLKHRNLVRLLGWGMEGDEKLLIYEFMPNRSLDLFIFDQENRARLNWATCRSIIDGIARGLVYLHEDSRPTIIHRDLKPSNVLLESTMVARISDFGMARIFSEKQSTANTRRVVGSLGYMAPEYAMGGIFSVKSDVFSFGVILLEIISGKKNTGFHVTELAPTLLAYAWRLWKDGTVLDLVDPSLLTEPDVSSEIRRCIQIGLLCLQEDPADRPTMSGAVTLLGSEAEALREPKQPAFSMVRTGPAVERSSDASFSANELTISGVTPR